MPVYETDLVKVAIKAVLGRVKFCRQSGNTGSWLPGHEGFVV